MPSKKPSSFAASSLAETNPSTSPVVNAFRTRTSLSAFSDPLRTRCPAAEPNPAPTPAETGPPIAPTPPPTMARPVGRRGLVLKFLQDDWMVHIKTIKNNFN